MEKDDRISWDEYFMAMARLASERSTCIRRKIGAVIVKDNRVVSTGYNGAPKGVSHCIDSECLRDKLEIKSGTQQEICKAVHAEQNAIIQAAYKGDSTKDGILYTTTSPCSICAKIIINAGIKRVVIGKDSYPDEYANKYFEEAKVIVNKIEE
jgi:dCMP deaminase